MRHGIALVICGSLVLAACGGDDDDGAKAGGNPLEQANNDDSGGNGSSGGPQPGLTGDPSDLPDDACKVVPTDLTDKLAPGNHVEGPDNLEQQGVASAHCAWVNDTVTLSLNYTAGIDPAMIKISVESDTKDANGEITQIAGDEAGIRKAAGGQLEINVIHEDVLVAVSLLTLQGDTMQSKDDVVAMAEAAVGSL
jgi:hypothetical protein